MSEKPCEYNCPKCGSNDCSRHFYAKGQLESRIGSNPSKTTEFVDRSLNYTGKVKKDCIVHHCRCCQYDWDTAALADIKMH